MSNASPWWKELNQLAPVNGALPRLAVVGVGQALRGDDGAGPAVVARVRELLPPDEALLLLDAAHAPENVLGRLIRFNPDVVLFIDAVRAGAPPGAVRWLAAGAAEAAGGSTHTLPLAMLAEFITAETGAAVYVIGIQPATTEFSAGLSPSVAVAVAGVANEIVAYWRRLVAACSAMSTGDVSVVNT
jgi:hydrogenase 3 maturation protease